MHHNGHKVIQPFWVERVIRLHTERKTYYVLITSGLEVTIYMTCTLYMADDHIYEIWGWTHKKGGKPCQKEI
jgi:hypothetical protein